MAWAANVRWSSSRCGDLTLQPGADLATAIAAHQQGDWADAESRYRRILARHPNAPDALHFFGLLRHHQGNSAAAVDIIRRALRITPGNPHAWINLGNILLTLDRDAEAIAAYHKAVEADPRNPDGWYNLGVAQRRAGDAAAAIAHFDRALGLRPGHARAHHQLGVAQRDLGQLDEAEASFRRALAIEPKRVFESLGMLLYRMGRFSDAAAIYRQWREAEPDNPVACHMAATGGDAVPDRAADRYVAEVFDRFAGTFEQNLEALGYQAPRLVVESLVRLRPASAPPAGILDAGCGTGLCGPLLQPLASRLTGVDLSPAMVAQARQKGVYDALVVGELCAFMSERPAEFDVIVAADTLVYFGVLSAAFLCAGSALKPGGLLVFTLELMEDESSGEGFRLEPHGRYSHRPAYVTAMLDHAGYVGALIQTVILRRERSANVRGLVVSARKLP